MTGRTAAALGLAALALATGSPVAAQPLDSLATPAPIAATAAPPDTSASVRTPRGAITRALLVPGLGQVYNRQPVKAPFAAALVVGAVVFAADRQRQYLQYRRATVYAGCLQDPDSDEDRVALCTEVAPDYVDEWTALGEPAFATVSGVRDRARGQRDVGFLVVGVAYALQALDAYVAAELADFDVSEDLAVIVRPGPGPPTVALRLRLD